MFCCVSPFHYPYVLSIKSAALIPSSTQQLSRKIYIGFEFSHKWIKFFYMFIINFLQHGETINHIHIFLFFLFAFYLRFSNTLWNLKDISCLHAKEYYLCFQKQNINQIWEIICFETILILYTIICLLLLIFQTERAISKTPQCWPALSHCCYFSTWDYCLLHLRLFSIKIYLVVVFLFSFTFKIIVFPTTFKFSELLEVQRQHSCSWYRILILFYLHLKLTYL